MPKKKEQDVELLDRSARIDKVLAEINKKAKPGQPIICRGKDAPNNMFGLRVWSSGILALDAILGPGGIPEGRTIEIYGAESTGKSTTLYTILGSAQRQGKEVALLEPENTFDPVYGRVCGIDVDNLIIAQPADGEQAFDLAEALLRSGVDVIGIDSVTALVPRSEVSGEMSEQFVGLHARLMSKALRKLTPACNYDKFRRGNVIFTNQIREKVGVMFGNPEIATGGRALRYYASVRLLLKALSADIIKVSDPNDPKQELTIGRGITVEVVKNKVGPPGTSCKFDLIFGRGIDPVLDVLWTGLQLGVITLAGTSSYTLPGLSTSIRGKEAVLEALRNDKDLYSSVRNAVRTVIYERRTTGLIPVEEELMEEEGTYDYVVTREDGEGGD